MVTLKMQLSAGLALSAQLGGLDPKALDPRARCLFDQLSQDQLRQIAQPLLSAPGVVRLH